MIKKIFLILFLLVATSAFTQTTTGIVQKNSRNLDIWYTLNLKEASIVDYMILEESKPNSLADAVKFAMSSGWVPLGGVSTTIISNYHYYTQAMVKYSK